MSNADDYREAAESHIQAAREMYSARHFVQAIYLSGLAVECLFRAFRARRNLIFDERHDLWELARSSKILDLVPEGATTYFAGALATVTARWLNSHRYLGERGMRRFLKEHRLDRRIKGDFLKENARRILSAAFDIVNVGLNKWN